MSTSTPKFFGYYEGLSKFPSYDPKDTVPRLFCMQQMTFGDGTLRTISLARLGHDRSYFYRVHKVCDDSMIQDEKAGYESAVIDLPSPPQEAA